MSDLPWITIGFIRSFILAIAADNTLTIDERKYFKATARNLIRAVKTATTDEEEMNYHHAFHNLRGSVLAAKLRRHLLVRNNNNT